MTLDPRLQKLNECDGLGDDIDKEVREMARRVHNAFPEIAEEHTEDEVYKKLLTDDMIAKIINGDIQEETA